MQRNYLKFDSRNLGRAMEMLHFGHAGLPLLVFPTSEGRFYDFENRGMVEALTEPLETGRLQLFCLDSVDSESWYNRRIPPRHRLLRHLEYERYLAEEVPVIVGALTTDTRLGCFGCSFGGYHAMNLALRHPERISFACAFSGLFDLSAFLGSYYDQDCYFHFPTHYLPNLTDERSLARMRRNRYILTTGLDDPCLQPNLNLHKIFDSKEIPHHFEASTTARSHDWPAWQQLLRRLVP